MAEEEVVSSEGEAVAASAAYVFIAKEAISQGKTIDPEHIQRDDDSSEVLIYLAIGRQTEWYNIGIDETNKPTGGCFAISNPDDFQAIMLNETDVQAIWGAYQIENFLSTEYKPDPHMDEVIAVFSANRNSSPETLDRISIGSRALLLEMIEHEKMDKERLKGGKIN
jgi:hypothetical protein